MAKSKSRARFLINDKLASFLRKPLNEDTKFMREVEKVMKEAGKYVEKVLKQNIRSMGAIGSGFMIKNTMHIVDYIPGSKKAISLKVGTKAWYDILIEKGLGYHSPTGGATPPEYAPTPEQEQMALSAPYTAKFRKRFYKPSPRTPRRFMKNTIKSTKNEVKKIIYDRLWKAFVKSTGRGRGSKPRILFSNAVQGR